MSNINQRLNGLDPLSYTGTNALQPTDFRTKTTDPTVNDSKNLYLGTWWLNTTTLSLWYLAALIGNQATWLRVTLNGASFFQGNSGGVVTPDVTGLLNIVGDGVSATVVGTPGTNTLTISVIGGMAVDSFPTDTGTAVPLVGVLNVLGGAAGRDINTSGAGNTIHVDLNNAITLGDLANIVPGTPSLTLTTGDLNMGGIFFDPTHTYKIKFPSNGGFTNDIFFYLNNIFMGQGAGNLTMTPGVAIFNIGIGSFALDNLTTGTQNTALGNASLTACTDGDNNCAFGYTALSQITTGDNNIGIGSASLAGVKTGIANLAFGTTAGSLYNAAESSNILIGDQVTGTLGESNVLRIGNGTGVAQGNISQAYIAACYSNYGVNNTFVGSNSGNFTLTTATANNNVSLGSAALNSLTTGALNSAIGTTALTSLTTGSNNSATGFHSMQNSTTAGNNSFYGYQSGVTLTTGTDNAGFGLNSFSIIATGIQNTGLGTNAGMSHTLADSNNICIGYNVVGVAGQSNTCRVGNIRGITTNINNAVAVLIDSTGQLGTISSSIRFKENIQDMDDYSDDLMDLRPVTFNYKKNSPKDRSVGLIAEEVEMVLPELVVYDECGLPQTVKYHDLTPMLLNELQKLYKRIMHQEDVIHELVQRIELLESKNH